jgi:hypothetical protein
MEVGATLEVPHEFASASHMFHPRIGRPRACPNRKKTVDGSVYSSHFHLFTVFLQATISYCKKQ